MHGKDEKPIVLVVDDQFGSFRSLGRLISPDAFHVVLATDDRDGLKYLEKKRIRSESSSSI